MSAQEKGADDIPREFRDDPTIAWAEVVAGNPAYKSESLHPLFIELLERYVGLLKRFVKVAKISDGYQLSLKELNVLLSTDARTDYLTSLSNRRDMLERLDTEISRASRYGDPFSLVLGDIDLFKQVNDEHGHEAGDRVIVAVADALRACIRREDHCARWGGEEFLICLPRAPLENALVVAEKLRAAVDGLRIDYDGEILSPTISLGVAEYRKGENVDDVIRGADRALFDAKEGGRNRVRSRDS